MDILLFSLIFALIGIVVATLARRADQRIQPVSAVLFAVYLAVDDLSTGLPNLVRALDVIPGHWNWSGKVLSLMFSAIVVFALRLSPDALGFRRQEHQKLAWMSLGLFAVWGACLGTIFTPGPVDAETLVFQATMPGLAEEIAYRGVAPAMLLSLMNRKPHIDGIPWVVIVATSLMFGLWHALSFKHGMMKFDLMAGLFPLLGSIPGGWLRFKTKSLFVPIVGHGTANVAFHIAGSLGSGG